MLRSKILVPDRIGYVSHPAYFRAARRATSDPIVEPGSGSGECCGDLNECDFH